MAGNKKNKFNVFISCLHSYEGIATAINQNLKRWGVPQQAIIQSSHPKHALTPGEGTIPDQLEDKLLQTNLLFFVYTFSSDDWSWCTWECGIVRGNRSVDTKTIVLQCTQDVPEIFKDELRVTITPESVLNFVTKLHREIGFIPGYLDAQGQPRALAGDISDEILNERSQGFYDDLCKARPPGSRSDVHLWDFLRLRLQPKSVQVLQQTPQEQTQEIISILEDNLEVRQPVYESIGSTALRQFGYGAYQEGLKLANLFRRWQEETQEDPKPWADELYLAVYRAATVRNPEPVNFSFRSARGATQWRFLPVVTRARSRPDDGREFDIYLVRVNPNDTIASPGTRPSAGATRKKAPRKAKKKAAKTRRKTVPGKKGTRSKKKKPT